MTPRLIQVGQLLPATQRVATIETLVRYAGAAGDFYPMHYDLAAARRQGHSELAVHGLLKAAWLYQYVASWSAGWADVEDLDIKYRAMDFRDGAISLGGRVAAVAGTTIDLAVWTADDQGAETTTGMARVRARGDATTQMTRQDATPTKEN